MVFKVPKVSLGKSVWFLTEQDITLYGKVTMISLAITENHTNVYYSIDVNGKIYTADEGSVVDNYENMPKPKYNIGDEVMFEYLTQDKSKVTTTDIIETIELYFYDKDKCEIQYYMQGDPEFWILEDEILDRMQDCPLLKTVMEQT